MKKRTYQSKEINQINWEYINLKTSFKSYCGRFLLDIYRPFLNISRTFALTVWVIPLSGQITEKTL